MEAAIRWSAGPSSDVQSYVLVDVAGSCITLNHARLDPDNEDVLTDHIARYEKVPHFTSFDWNKTDPSLLVLGLLNGDASLLAVNPERRTIQPLQLLPAKSRRKTNSIAFSTDRLVAIAHDRTRQDASLIVYDVDGGRDPLATLCHGEGVNSIRFFPDHPNEFVASVNRQALKLFDIRVPHPAGAGSEHQPAAWTSQVNNIAIDPMDDNYFASGGGNGHNGVNIWDRRWFTRPSSPGSAPHQPSMSVLDIQPAVEDPRPTNIWSIRYCGRKRGRFGVLSSTGAVRVYDLATHSATFKSRMPVTANFHGGDTWNGPHYVRNSHDLRLPFYDPEPESDRSFGEKARVIAFDWIGNGSVEEQSVLALHSNRDISMLHAPRPAMAQLTSRNEVAISRREVAILQPTQNQPRAADEVMEAKRKLENKIDPGRRSIKAIDFDKMQLAKRKDEESKRAQQEAEGILPRIKPSIPAGPFELPRVYSTDEFKKALAFLNVHKRRCREGYRLDASKNRIITKEDPALERLWAIISRLESLAANGGMVSDELDLSWLGVQGIWESQLGPGKTRILPGRKLLSTSFATSVQWLVKIHGLPSLEPLPELSQYRRLLALEICGWCFSREGIEGKCTNLIEQKQYHRAVAVAIFQGHNDLALNMLRNLTRNKLIVDPGLAALLAASELNQDQLNLCKWMQEDAKDPYLKSVLRWLDGQDWKAVADNTALNLSDRVSVALRYLDDERLSRFIQDTTRACVKQGDLAGVLLTGLTEAAMPLLQSYLSLTSDLQTAVLAASLTNPLYVQDVRFPLWKETYLELLQSWRLFVERTRYTVEHARRAVERDGTRLVPAPPRQIGLRCVHCNGSLAGGAAGNKATMGFDGPAVSRHGSGANVQAQRVAEASGTVCPRCGRHLPRCAVCLQWLGTPERTGLGGGGKKEAGTGTDGNGDGEKSSAAAAGPRGREAALDVSLSRFVTFCANCSHGLHAHHAKQWFAKHGMCPVPDCGCLCGVRR